MDKMEEVLKHAGVKPTRHRLSVLRVLLDAPCPQTAEQVYMALRKSDVQINLSSVYRSLELLQEHDFLTRTVTPDDSRALYAPASAGHQHNLICSQCHRTIALPGCPLGGYEHDIAREMDFDVTGHRLEIFGVCRDCRQGKSES